MAKKKGIPGLGKKAAGGLFTNAGDVFSPEELRGLAQMGKLKRVPGGYQVTQDVLDLAMTRRTFDPTKAAMDALAEPVMPVGEKAILEELGMAPKAVVREAIKPAAHPAVARGAEKAKSSWLRFAGRGAAKAEGAGGAIEAAAGIAKYGKWPMRLLKGAGWVGAAMLALDLADTVYGQTIGKRKEREQEMRDEEALTAGAWQGVLAEADAREAEASQAATARFLQTQAGAQAVLEAGQQGDLQGLLMGREDEIRKLAVRDRPTLLDLLAQGGGV